MCQRGLTHPSNLRTYMFIYTGEKPYRCNVCEKQLTQLSCLKKHMIAHGSDSPHNWDLCQVQFVKCSNLKTPMIRHNKRVWSTTTQLCWIEPFADSAVQTVNHRRLSVSGRSSTVLEQSARQCHVSQFVVGFPASTETRSSSSHSQTLSCDIS